LSESKPPRPPDTAPSLVFSWPLYRKIEPQAGVPGEKLVSELRRFLGAYDGYCPNCKLQSTFRFVQDDIVTSLIRDEGIWSNHLKIGSRALNPWLEAPRFDLVARCTRRHHEVRAMFYLWHSGEDLSKQSVFLRKVGQYPSLADLQSGDTARFQSILGEEKAKELSVARVQYQHNFSAAAYLYLRRVFEHLIRAVAKGASTAKGWKQASFEKADMRGRIRMLRAHLPKEVVKDGTLYGVLSEGVHNLSDSQCADYYATLEKGTVLILDEIMREQERAKDIAEYSAELQKLRHKITQARGEAGDG
jgi:hypothetical protein